jgi:hypothetical protein
VLEEFGFGLKTRCNRIPLHCRKFSNSDWKMIEDRIEKKLNSGKENIYQLDDV